MTIAIDIGNSNIVVALHNGIDWANSFRYETKATQPEFYYEGALRNILLEWGISVSEVQHYIVSSVVPDLNEVIRQAVHFLSGKEALFLGPEIFKVLDLQVPHPYEIGSDIVSNAFAATRLYGPKCIIVDFGTALTFTVVDKSVGIRGVTISPGIKTAMQSLSSNTAQLPIVPLELPESVLGYNTVSAIQAGVLYGTVGTVKEILQRLKSEFGSDYQVIATGGLSSVLHPLDIFFQIKDKMLTLEGMRLIFQFVNK